MQDMGMIQKTSASEHIKIYFFNFYIIILKSLKKNQFNTVKHKLKRKNKHILERLRI